MIASTRPVRAGEAVGRWFEHEARRHGGFEVEVVDLARLALPLLDEPHHPRLARYQHEHTRRWSEIVSRADAFAFVHPEYNHSFTAPLKNAIDFLHHEWAYKPVGLVSYGGVAGGTRAVQALKPVLVVLRMAPASTGVIIPFVSERIEEGGFRASEELEQAAAQMLDELCELERALRGLRRAR